MDINREIGLLNAKRSALEKGLHIAALIEHLGKSLDAAATARQPGNELTTEAMSYYEQLDELSRSLPPPLLKTRIAGLSDELQRDFNHILYITRLVRGATPCPEPTTEVDDVDRFLSRFADHSSRLVGFRVALYRRGESSPALKFDIPTALLTKRLRAVHSLQRHCRVKVRNEVKALRDDTRRTLTNPGLSQPMRDELQAVVEDLQTIIRHIEDGGEIAELPVVVETLRWDPAPMSTRELSEMLRGEEVEEIPLEEITITAPPDVPEPDFSETLHYWLNTPLDVSWDAVKQWQRRRSRP